MKIILALILPCLLVILFTRVTYNHYVGTILTIALLIASIYKGYTQASIINILDFISLTAGFLYSRNMVKKFKG
nr:CsbA family protein [Litchfieldia alkalitelluris]